jgi:hypothetical protein
MKNLFITVTALLISFLSLAQSPAIAVHSEGNSSASGIDVSENYVIISAYNRNKVTASGDNIATDERLAVKAAPQGTDIYIQSNFEGATSMQYIVTSSAGEVLSMQEFKLAAGVHTRTLDISGYTSGDYFLTAKVKSLVTKASNTYVFKVQKK